MASINNNSLSTTNKMFYILELGDNAERMEIQFVPEEIDINSVAQQSKVDIVGRNIPRYHTINGEISMKLKFDFYADEAEKLSVMERVNWLQALVHNNGVKRKKNVVIVFGDLFEGPQWVWTVESVSVKYSQFRSDVNFRPQSAQVDVSFKLDPGYNIVSSDFRK